MKTLGYFLLACIFALFVIPFNKEKTEPKPQIKAIMELPKQKECCDSLKQTKKIDSFVRKIELNKKYLKHKLKN